MQNAECKKGSARTVPFLDFASCILHFAKRVWPAIAAIAVTAAIPSVAAACPVCYGNPAAPMNKGTSNAIWFLLGIVGFVQAGFVALFFTFWKRARDLRKRRESFALIEGGAR